MAEMYFPQPKMGGGMKTYSRIRHVLSVVGLVVGVAGALLLEGLLAILSIVVGLMIVCISMYIRYDGIVIDESRRLVYNRWIEKYPLEIDQIRHATFYETGDGKYYQLGILSSYHTCLFSYVKHVEEADARKAVEKLREMNPNIEIKVDRM